MVRWRTLGTMALDGIAAALLSSPCAVCGRVALRVTGGAVCEDCWRNVPLLTPPLCSVCGSALPSSGSECACEDLPPLVDSARALGPYEGTLRSAIHALKYERRRSVAPRLARLARDHCAGLFEGADALVPVPLHAWRRWNRGFNQAEEIACHLPLPVWRVLRRVRRTAAQAGLTEHARVRNVSGAFRGRRFTRRDRVNGACVVLVDDVSTTGATLAACAEVLKELGAGEVRALTIARTVRADRVRS